MLRPARFAAKELAGFALAAAFIAACSTPSFDSPTPFSCAGQGRCPNGFQCVSEVCVRAGTDVAPDTYPSLLASSTAPVIPAALPDPDRQGVLACWSTVEDSRQGIVRGAFIQPDGAVVSAGVLAWFDAEGGDFVGACAPVPNTEGKILVAGWLQRLGRAEMRLAVWTPSEANGHTGVSTSFYSEPQAAASAIQANQFRIDVVGDEVWVPNGQSTGVAPVGNTGALQRLLRYRVNAADLAAGQPRRDVLGCESPCRQTTYSTLLYAGTTGAWVSTDDTEPRIGFFPSATSANIALRPFTTADPVYLIVRPLVPATIPDSSGQMVEQLALIWSDPAGVFKTGENQRVAWIFTPPTFSMGKAIVGPRLPFKRLDTTHPAALYHHGKLYVFGTPVGEPVPPEGYTPVDGGSDIEPDDAGPLVSTQAQGDTPKPGPFNMYSVEWGAPLDRPFTVERTISARFATASVTAGSARVMPGTDAANFVLVWVEYYPPDPVGRGARYAIYAQRQPLP